MSGAVAATAAPDWIRPPFRGTGGAASALVETCILKFRDSKYLESGDGFPLPAFAGTSFVGMTTFQRDTLPLRWASFPRKRESISVSESRNLSYIHYYPDGEWP